MAPLNNSRLRTMRARNQFDALNGEIANWLDKEAYSIRIERDANTGEDVARIEAAEQPPSMWAVIVGEIVHDFRSALDNAIHDLTVLHSGAPVKTSEFPIFEDRNRYLKDSPRKIGTLRTECQAIIEKMQPFAHPPATEQALWILHELSNMDKHRTLPLVVTAKSIQMAEFKVGGGAIASNVRLVPQGRIEPNAEIARWSTTVSSQGHVNINLKLAREIALDVSAFMPDGIVAVETALGNIGRAVHNSIAALEQFNI